MNRDERIRRLVEDARRHVNEELERMQRTGELDRALRRLERARDLVARQREHASRPRTDSGASYDPEVHCASCHWLGKLRVGTVERDAGCMGVLRLCDAHVHHEYPAAPDLAPQREVSITREEGEDLVRAMWTAFGKAAR